MALKLQQGVVVDAYSLSKKTSFHFRNLLSWKKLSSSAKKGGKPYEIYGIRLALSQVGKDDTLFIVSLFISEKEPAFASLCKVLDLDVKNARAELISKLMSRDLLTAIGTNDSKTLRFIAASSSDNSPGAAFVSSMLGKHKKWLHNLTDIAFKESENDLQMVKSALPSVSECAIDNDVANSLGDDDNA